MEQIIPKTEPTECQVCDIKFPDSEEFERHKAIHAYKRPFQCDQCGKQFVHPSSLRAHRKSVHTNESRKKCTICGILVRPTTSLRKHMRIHSGEKPHECPTCGKTFVRKDNMTSHIKIHEGIAPGPLRTCPICARTFTRKGRFTHHILNRHKTAPSSDDEAKKVKRERAKEVRLKKIKNETPPDQIE